MDLLALVLAVGTGVVVIVVAVAVVLVVLITALSLRGRQVRAAARRDVDAARGRAGRTEMGPGVAGGRDDRPSDEAS